MNKYYKFINERKIEEFKNQYVVIDNRIYSGVITPELLKKAGYKAFVSSEAPEYDSEKQCVCKKYIDGEDVITEVYEVVDIADEIAEE